MLRKPKSESGESRTDPIWEVGSFGTTGCHGRNLMNPARISELNGTRFAFAQGGPAGIRVVHVTPPVASRLIRNGECAEVQWGKAEMPLRYDAAPCLLDNDGNSVVPLLLDAIRGVQRSTWIGKFASAFRSTRTTLAGVVGAQLLSSYQAWRKNHPEAIAKSYVDALPWAPPLVESAATRIKKYRQNVNAIAGRKKLRQKC